MFAASGNVEQGHSAFIRWERDGGVGRLSCGEHPNTITFTRPQLDQGDAVKVLLMVACLFIASAGNGQTAVVVNPNTGKPTVVHKNSNGVTTTQTSHGGTSNKNGVAVAQGPNGSAAVNSHTGNAAVAHTNSNGVTTTQTSNGGKAKTKNGMGVAQGPGGTTCVKGKYNQGCKK